MIDADKALDFVEFVTSRFDVWSKRQQGLPQPWTENPIVAHRKFTNVYRAVDFGSQFVLTDLVEDGLSERDMLMRLFLYRHTGRVEAWEAASLATGLPTKENLWDFHAAMSAYRGAAERKPVFTGAYLVFPQSQVPGTDKLDAIFQLTERLFHPDSPDDLVPDFLAAKNQADRFAALRRNKGVADFMSMQILTDWGYTPHCGEDREDEFIVLGPGARRGAAALAPGQDPSVAFNWAVRAVRSTGMAIDAPSGPRPPSWMDVQNCLCEFSKYVRYQDKLDQDSGTPQRLYKPDHPGVQLPPVLPEHW